MIYDHKATKMVMLTNNDALNYDKGPFDYQIFETGNVLVDKLYFEDKPVIFLQLIDGESILVKRFEPPFDDENEEFFAFFEDLVKSLYESTDYISLLYLYFQGIADCEADVIRLLEHAGYVESYVEDGYVYTKTIDGFWLRAKLGPAYSDLEWEDCRLVERLGVKKFQEESEVALFEGE